jgi:hypothetical protein
VHLRQSVVLWNESFQTLHKGISVNQHVWAFRNLISLGIVCLLMVAILMGCSALPGMGGGSIGTVSRVSDLVEQNQTQVQGTNPLNQDDTIRLANGGEGLLDFDGGLLLRLFNDSQVGGVQAESAQETALLVRMRLEFGGFTGQLTQNGGQVVFETPNGATINVAGTDFFLVYNQAGGETYCGNWEGQMWVEANGSGRMPVASGLIYRVEPGGQPAPWRQMPWSMDQFAQLARATGTPLGPIEIASRFGQ